MCINGASKSLTVYINVTTPAQQGFHNEKVDEQCGRLSVLGR